MLSIVAIGRNEADNIDRLGSSIGRLKARFGFDVQRIFVDSASDDRSIALASNHFDEIYVLNDSRFLCASAARHVGTLEAKYPWILYLDADMEVCEEFISRLRDLVNQPTDNAGFVGKYIHVYDNGTEAIWEFCPKPSANMRAEDFGGAVLLKREAVVAAGNWNPAVFGMEEVELYSRLGKGDHVVEYLPIPMVRHFDPFRTKSENLRRLLYPSAGLGKVFFGFGQVLRSLWDDGNLMYLMRLWPAPFFFWLAATLIVLVGALVSWSLGVALLTVGLIALVLWLGAGRVYRYVTLPLSAIPGWYKYDSSFRPSISRKPWRADSADPLSSAVSQGESS